MIYRFYGVSFLILSRDVDVIDYHCMYAQALDLDEIERYQQHVYAGGDSKKWEWSHPDLADRMGGKCRRRTRWRENPDGRSPMEQELLHNFKGPAVRGKPNLALEAMGEKLVLLDLDEHGNPIIPNGYMFVPVEQEKIDATPESDINPETGLPSWIPLPNQQKLTPEQIDNKNQAIVHSLQAIFKTPLSPKQEGEEDYGSER